MKRHLFENELLNYVLIDKKKFFIFIVYCTGIVCKNFSFSSKISVLHNNFYQLKFSVVTMTNLLNRMSLFLFFTLYQVVIFSPI